MSAIFLKNAKNLMWIFAGPMINAQEDKFAILADLMVGLEKLNFFEKSLLLLCFSIYMDFLKIHIRNHRLSEKTVSMFSFKIVNQTTL